MINEILITMGIPILRNLSGWLKSSLKDNKIKRYELRKLGYTSLNIAILSLCTYFGANELGLNLSASGSATIGTLLEITLKAIKENKVVRA